MTKLNKTFLFLNLAFIAAIIAVGAVLAWTGPSGAPPTGSGLFYYSGGNIGIGTTNPDAKLHVVGSPKFVDGNQGVGKVLTSDANGVGNWQTPSGGGKIVQVVNYETGAVATGSTIIPSDDTIPQNTEGDEYMTLVITPTNANNILIIVVNGFLWVSATTHPTVALFQDTTVNAIAVSIHTITGGWFNGFSLIHKMIAGTTSPTTFKVRIGPNSENPATINLNGAAGVRRYGGAAASSITITEIAP